MLKDGLINDTALSSPLASASLLNPKNSGKGKKLVAAVILTSLIDAFSILVIYLLVNFSNSGEILYISKDMELPAASESVALQRTTLVKIEKDQLFVEDKPVTQGALVETLIDIRKELAKAAEVKDFKLTVQADRRVTYKVINQVVLAGSHAGFGEIKFAVLAK